jgi:DNA polymerase III epsilon subunit-like protein
MNKLQPFKLPNTFLASIEDVISYIEGKYPATLPVFSDGIDIEKLLHKLQQCKDEYTNTEQYWQEHRYSACLHLAEYYHELILLDTQSIPKPVGSPENPLICVESKLGVYHVRKDFDTMSKELDIPRCVQNTQCIQWIPMHDIQSSNKYKPCTKCKAKRLVAHPWTYSEWKSWTNEAQHLADLEIFKDDAFIVYDTETIGHGANQCIIWDFAAVLITSKATQSFEDKEAQSLVFQRYIPPPLSMMNMIDEYTFSASTTLKVFENNVFKPLRKQNVSFKSVWNEYLAFTAPYKRVWHIAHNGSVYDETVLSNELARDGLVCPDNFYFGDSWRGVLPPLLNSPSEQLSHMFALCLTEPHTESKKVPIASSLLPYAQGIHLMQTSTQAHTALYDAIMLRDLLCSVALQMISVQSDDKEKECIPLYETRINVSRTLYHEWTKHDLKEQYQHIDNGPLLPELVYLMIRDGSSSKGWHKLLSPTDVQCIEYEAKTIASMRYIHTDVHASHDDRCVDLQNYTKDSLRIVGATCTITHHDCGRARALYHIKPAAHKVFDILNQFQQSNELEFFYNGKKAGKRHIHCISEHTKAFHVRTCTAGTSLRNLGFQHQIVTVETVNSGICKRCFEPWKDALRKKGIV